MPFQGDLNFLFNDYVLMSPKWKSTAKIPLGPPHLYKQLLYHKLFQLPLSKAGAHCLVTQVS